MKTYVVMSDELTLVHVKLFFKESLKKFNLRFTTRTNEHYYFKERELKIIFYNYENVNLKKVQNRYFNQTETTILLIPPLEISPQSSKYNFDEINSLKISNAKVYTFEEFRKEDFYDSLFALIFEKVRNKVYWINKVSLKIFSKEMFKTELDENQIYYFSKNEAINALKNYLESQIRYSETQIKDHHDSISRYRNALENINS